MVGLRDGADVVGCCEGDTDGIRVGDDDSGDLVGCLVGDSVGNADGNCVGLEVTGEPVGGGLRWSVKL